MLKILKYDWKNGWNAVKFPLIAAAVVSALLGIVMGLLGGQVAIGQQLFAVVGESSMDYVVMFLSIGWFSVMVALLVLTVDAIFRNLSTRMFGPEGYLTHTLPVETWELLAGKALGTWIFGVFMVCVAIFSVVLVVLCTAVTSIELTKLMETIVEFLPKLGAYHFRQMAVGAGYLLYGIGAFLIWSLMIVVQYQFICIASRLFGRFHAAGAIILFCLLLSLEGNLNRLFSMGFLVALLTSAACFLGSHWLLRHKLSL